MQKAAPRRRGRLGVAERPAGCSHASAGGRDRPRSWRGRWPTRCTRLSESLGGSGSADACRRV